MQTNANTLFLCKSENIFSDYCVSFSLSDLNLHRFVSQHIVTFLQTTKSKIVGNFALNLYINLCNLKQ